MNDQSHNPQPCPQDSNNRQRFCLPRRALLGGLLASGVHQACAALEKDSTSVTTAQDAGSEANATDASTASEAAQAAGTTAQQTSPGWATGGTKAMTAVDSYPDPFSEPDAACVLTCTLTQGPCWAPSAPVRQDVSEGETGLPLRLLLRVVDDTCAPIQGAEVEIWYCNVDGVYSGADVENPDFCTGSDDHALESYFFRGRAIADADGKVTFDGCFPGWYASRAVHIHFLVRRGDDVGAATTSGTSVISQLFFPESVTQEIFDSVANYRERGQPDTTFETDTVLSQTEAIDPYLVEYAKMPDGAMLAWKTIQLSTTESCGTSGEAPGAGPMGKPPQ